MNPEPPAEPEASLRLFAGIDFPDQVKLQIKDVLSRLEKGAVFTGSHPAWVRPEGVHLTLIFFGSQDPARLDILNNALRNGSALHQPLRIQLGKLELFPEPRNPKVISLGIGGELEKLAALHASLATACGAEGFPVETRPYRPHLTLARIKSRKGLEGLSALVRSHAGMGTASFTADKVTLFQSQPAAGGSIYLPLTEFALESSNRE